MTNMMTTITDYYKIYIQETCDLRQHIGHQLAMNVAQGFAHQIAGDKARFRCACSTPDAHMKAQGLLSFHSQVALFWGSTVPGL